MTEHQASVIILKDFMQHILQCSLRPVSEVDEDGVDIGTKYIAALYEDKYGNVYCKNCNALLLPKGFI